MSLLTLHTVATDTLLGHSQNHLRGSGWVHAQHFSIGAYGVPTRYREVVLTVSKYGLDMKTYKFVTIWRVKAPIESVWNEIYHSKNWPIWWKGVESVVELRHGDDRGVGSLHRYTWKSKLPYKLSFDMETIRIEPPLLLEGVARGELQGRGLWQLSTDGNETIVRYDWNVETTKRWMNLLVPLARPLFKWNHNVVMSWGAKGLEERIGGPVVEQSR